MSLLVLTSPSSQVNLPVAGYSLWYRADGLAAGSENRFGVVNGVPDVTTWKDYYGSGVNALGAIIGTSPSLSGTIGSKNAIDFDGVQDVLDLPKTFLKNLAGATVFVICQADALVAATENELVFFSINGSDGGRFSLSIDQATSRFRTRCRRLDADLYANTHQLLGNTDITNAKVMAISISWSTGLGFMYDSGLPANWEYKISDTQGNCSNTDNTYASIGNLISGGNYPFNGRISDVVLYPFALTEAQVQQVSTYLQSFRSIATPAAPSTQAQTTTFLNRLTALGYSQPSALVQTALNRFIYRQVTNGNWALLDRLGIFQLGDSSSSLVDLIDPTKSITLMGSPTYDSRGYTGNGSSMYIKTGFIPSGGTNYTQNSAIMGAYGRKDGVDAGVLFGAKDASNAVKMYPRYTDGLMYGGINQAGGTGTSITNYSGFGISYAKRTAANAQHIGINNDPLKTTTTASTVRPTVEVYLLAHNNNGSAAEYYTGQVSMWFAGSSALDVDSLVSDYKAFEMEIGIMS